MRRTAIYPGSFDPITVGHFEIIKKAAKLFDRVYVVVCVNPDKVSTFTPDERVEMIKACVAGIPNVSVDKYFGLSLNYAEKIKACAMIRGVRDTTDFQKEITLYHFNHHMNRNIETVILFPDAENMFISSSSIKDLATVKADFKEYVPACAYELIKKRLCK